MLVDRHHTQYLIDLGQVAQDKSAKQLAPLKDRLDAFLGTLGGAASSSARLAFEEVMQHLPKDDHPWAAVRRLDPDTLAGGPPAAILLLGQVDDDPDGEEDGNRLPDISTQAGPWDVFFTALRRWDTSEIQRWIGPLGWQQPHTPLELTQDPEIAGPSASARPVEPAPTTQGEAATLAAQEADARSRKAMRRVGIAVAASGGGALLLGLGRALGNPSRTPLGTPSGAKEVTP